MRYSIYKFRTICQGHSLSNARVSTNTDEIPTVVFLVKRSINSWNKKVLDMYGYVVIYYYMYIDYTDYTFSFNPPIYIILKKKRKEQQ